VPLLLNLSSG